MAETSPPELDPLYYLHNFELLCDTVVQQYRDLLSAQELGFLRRFGELPSSARCLYVRLVSRVGPLFRPEKLSYPELGELAEPLRELLQSKLLGTVTTPELEDIFRLCRKDEITEIFAGKLDTEARRKEDMLLSLQARELQVQELECLWGDWYQQDLVEPCDREVVDTLLLLFYGNRRQNLTDFVLSDLGVTCYQPYELDRDFRLFETRVHIEEYLLVGTLRDLFHVGVEAADELQVEALVEHLGDRVSPPYLKARWDALRNQVARQLERYQSVELALAVYALSDSHPARERQVRILHGQGQTESALQLCQQIEAQPLCEEELDFTRRQIPLLQKKLGLEFQAPLRPDFPGQRLQLHPGEGSVEQCVAQYYQQDWEQLHYVESSLINGLFGLALWEQIFLPLPGAFVNPFQEAPLDMYTGGFYARRRAAIDGRLSALVKGDLPTEILAAYDRYQGINCRWVNWRAIDRNLVANALHCIPARHLMAIWQRILFDPQANRSGLPDLLALEPGRGYCMIEVKGPGDQLQLNQKRWMRFFQQQQIPFLVAWVDWQDE